MDSENISTSQDGFGTRCPHPEFFCYFYRVQKFLQQYIVCGLPGSPVTRFLCFVIFNIDKRLILW